MTKDLILLLDRFYKGCEYTIGHLYRNMNGQMVYICDMLEDKDRGLKQKWPLSQILANKVYGETAIPRGTYELVPTVSPKFKYRVWGKKYNGIVPEYKNVPGFSGVRMHPANKATELLGCTAPGKNTIKGQVTQSQATYYTLMDKYFMPTWDKGGKVWITIQ